VSKIKLLYLIESSETGGAENIFLSLVEMTDRERFSVSVGLFYRGWLYDELVKRGYTPIVFVNKRGGYDLSLLLQLIKYIKKNRIDLVCSHLFSANLYAGVAGKISRVPVVAVFHGTVDVSSNDKKAKFKFFVLNGCVRKIVYVSKYLEEFFSLNYNANRVKSQVIHNGIDLSSKIVIGHNDFTRERFGIDVEDFLVIAVGDMRPAKDYPTLLKAIALAVKEIKHLKLIIAGTETDLIVELESLKKNLRLTDYVEYLGYRENVRTILPYCDAYVSSSVSEGFSLTIVEAMSARIPVIATQSGGPEEIVKHEVTGILVEPGVPHLLAKAIVNLSKNRHLKNHLVESAAQMVVKKFSSKLMISQYERLFEEVCRD